MKRRFFAVSLLVVGLLAFIVSWDKLVDGFNFIGQPPESNRETYYAIIGQGLFYFLLSLTISLFGFLLLLKTEEGKLKLARAILFTLLGIWFLLEIPIYKCNFYEIKHSFWESKQGHFH
jgi:hypothetical protein